MAKGKKDNDIVVSFIGGSSEGVTGSCVSVSYPKKDKDKGLILIEMGLVQGGNTILAEYNDNKKILENIPMKEAEYVFIAHSHQDHEGNLPALIPNGFKGRIIMTYENLEISKKLLPDTAYIHKKNIEALQSKGKKTKPLYTEPNAYEILNMVDTYSIGEMHKLNEYISFRFRNNSHVVGATQLELFIKKPNGVIKKILYTSDLGSPTNKKLQPFLKDNEIVTTANLAIFESTYGSSDRSFTEKEAIAERIELEKYITQFVKEGNRVFIPCFSYGRCQSQMVFMYEHFKDKEWFKEIPVLVDSKLANEINSVYSRILTGEDKKYFDEVMSWKNFKFIKDYNGTIASLSKRFPCVVLSSSGMISAGHSVLYAKSFLSCSKDAILFCGFCSPNTIGYKILDENQKTVTIEKSTILKRCFVHKFTTFTSHAQQSDLVNYMKQINVDSVVLHHGDKEAKEELKKKATEELRKIGKTTPISCAYKDYQVIL